MTYEQRIAEIATEMAKATWDKLGEDIKKPDAWNSYLNETDRQEYISNYKVCAAIALKHMAEMYDKGYEAAFYDGDAAHKEQCNYNLQSLGLIQPQKP